MKDFYGKEIKVGDVVELRADGNDEGSTFRRGKVLLDTKRRLVIETMQKTPNGVEYWKIPLSYLEMSNDIVKVESE